MHVTGISTQRDPQLVLRAQGSRKSKLEGQQGVVVLDDDFSTWEVEAGGAVLCHHQLHRKFENCLGYLLHETLSVEEQGPNT